MDVEVHTHTRVDDGLADALRDAVSTVASYEPAVPTGDWSVTFVLCDDDEISRLHAEFFDDDSVTDVISFPSGDDFDAASGYLGDIVIGVDQAARQAANEGHSVTREVVLLAIHGMLHLCGFDDLGDEDRVAMFARQSELLERLERESGPL